MPFSFSTLTHSSFVSAISSSPVVCELEFKSQPSSQFVTIGLYPMVTNWEAMMTLWR